MPRWSIAIVVALSLLRPAAAAAQEVVYRIPVTGTIELGLAPYIQRVLREAEEAGARAAILDVNTLGGRVDAALNIIDAVSMARIPVYALVDPRAISAGDTTSTEPSTLPPHTRFVRCKRVCLTTVRST